MSDLLTEKQVAALLNVAPISLRAARCRGPIPGRLWIPFVRLGKLVRYRREDVQKYLAENLVEATTAD